MLLLSMSEEPPKYFNFAHDVVERRANDRPEALALWCVREQDSTEETFTFSQLAQNLRRAASFFHQLGLRRGDRVLVITPRIPQWWIAMLGLTRLGVVPIPGTPLLTARDIRYRLETSEACALLTDAEGANRAEGLQIQHRILVGSERPGWTSFDAGLAQADLGFDPEPTLSSDPGIIYFTSGTTGPPKMVLHTQASYGLGHRITGELCLDLKPD